MLWGRSDFLEVYLSERLLGLGAVRGGASRWESVEGVRDALTRLKAVFASDDLPSVGRVRVWLSSALARPFLVPAAAGARTRREAAALAAAMAADATGLDGEVKVWLDRWTKGKPTMAAGMPQAVWVALQDVVAARRAWRTGARGRRNVPVIELVSVRPWWNLPFDSLLDESSRVDGALGWSLQDGDGVLSGVVARGSVTDAGFDRLAAHDADGTLLRRRLEASWTTAMPPMHLIFGHEGKGANTLTLPIGTWHGVQRGDA